MSPTIDEQPISQINDSLPRKRRSSRLSQLGSLIYSAMAFSKSQKVHPSSVFTRSSSEINRMQLVSFGKLLIEMIFSGGDPQTNLSKNELEAMVFRDSYDLEVLVFFLKYCAMMPPTATQSEEESIQQHHLTGGCCTRCKQKKLRLGNFLIQKLLLEGGPKVKRYKEELEKEVELDSRHLGCLDIFNKYTNKNSIASLLSSFETDSNIEFREKLKRLGGHLVRQVMADKDRKTYLSREDLLIVVDMDVMIGVSFQEMWVKYNKMKSTHVEGDEVCGFDEAKLQYCFRNSIF